MDPFDPVSKTLRPEPAAIAKSAATCFSGTHGRQLLQYLRAITVERTLGPAADDTHLRHLEGQRQLVQHIAALIDRGRVGPLSTEISIDDEQRKRP